MNRQRRFLPFLVLGLLAASPSARAAEGPFVGVDLGAAVPTNNNFNAHVKLGATGAPYGGYMFNDYVGLQGGLHFTFFEPDNDHRRNLPPILQSSNGLHSTNIENENQTTTMAGATFGPRFELPLGDLFDLYVTAQGGGYKGLGGRLNQWAPGFLAGGGIDFNVTHNLALGVFGRWNRVYMAPHPTFLFGQAGNAQGPNDAQFATAGVSLKYSFGEEPPPPPPVAPAPPPIAQAPPAPPTHKKIVLRSVHFDFDKSNIRADARPVLDEAAQTLKEMKDSEVVVVEGHTDSKGSDAYNMKLSMRRANSVRDYLIAHGIAASRIRAEGFGESRPVASNDTDDGRAQNRRVELHLE